METRTIETTTHGRYLYEDRGAERLLVGFHGYAEVAEWHLAELEKIPGIERWSIAAVQALHPFYTRAGIIVANWLTSQDRELAIADNIAYVQRVLAALPRPRTLVFLGFSQGASMAARAAAYATRADALILLGGDIPPEIKEDASVNLPPTLLVRGEKDEWYTQEKLNKDLSYLGNRARSLVFAGGHEWTDASRAAVGEVLGAL
ncbi:MAG TPA: phospholipase [Thermoanaerobaculia bacterium]|nr:phospholipase [Thermoanaerobaculia bacterium]